jgi:tRNA-modifying protein YgfZ
VEGSAQQSNPAPRDYHAQRIALGIPEGGVDITEGETALDASIDFLHGVSFSKGCYVGQEITARMHFKDVTRKGFFLVQSAAPLPSAPADIVASGKKIAQLRSAHGHTGIAYGRFDEAKNTIEGLETSQIGEHAVTLSTPEWQAEKWQKFLAVRDESA